MTMNMNSNHDNRDNKEIAIIEEYWPSTSHHNHNHHHHNRQPTKNIINNYSNNSISSNSKKDNGNANPQQYQKDWFEYYDTIAFPLSTTSTSTSTSTSPTSTTDGMTMVLRCMDSLTPLDMIDLSNGRCDATGNRVWMGAVFFIECMVRQLPSVVDYNSIIQHSQREREREQQHHQLTSSTLQKREQKRKVLLELRRTLFHNKHVLELGSGTGASLISIGVMATTTAASALARTAVSGTIRQTETERQAAHRGIVPIKPKMMTLTDNDTTVLSLCRLNCEFNFGTKKEYPHQKQSNPLNNDNNNGSDSNSCGDGDSGVGGGGGGDKEEEELGVNYRVCHLDWGAQLCTNTQQQYHHPSVVQQHNSNVSSVPAGSQDTVIATDVIYDLATIPLLFQTASSLLKKNNSNNKNNIDDNCNDDVDDDNSDCENQYTYFVLAHVPRADVDCGTGHDIRTALEERILTEAATHGFLTLGRTSSSNSNSNRSPLELFQVLYDNVAENDNNNNNNSNNNSNNHKHAIIRPHHLLDLWGDDDDDDVELEEERSRNVPQWKNDKNNTESQTNTNTNTNTKKETKKIKKNIQSLSPDYDYAELDSCGASILIFEKKKKGRTKRAQHK